MSVATRNKGVPLNETTWNFSPAQWDGIIVAGLVASSLSFAANIGVICIHTLLTCIRPYIVNRLSLRMILISCICNLIFCVCQLVTDRIPSVSSSCRAFAYVLIASDTMACMCLAMVSLNLVMIFVLKVPKSLKTEIVYYLIVAASGILVTIIPVYVGNRKGPRNKEEATSCWYHYYFDGRMNNIFNWMYYYGWVMFSIVIAALFAAISIRFVGKRQRNFTSVLNIFSNNKKDGSSIALIRKYTKDTDVFLKIAKRCTLYSLIPLLCKSWGVGIEIAAAVGAHIPYAIFLIDRLFSCLLGSMVGCLYFSDPAIIACFKYYADFIKHKYVYDYFVIKYQPMGHSSSEKNAQYPQSIEIMLVRDINTPPNITISDTTHLRRNTVVTLDKETSQFSVDNDPRINLPESILETRNTGVTTFLSNNQEPNSPILQVVKGGCLIPSVTKYNIIKSTSLNGTIFSPNDQFLTTTNAESKGKSVFSFFSKGNSKLIPMHRVRGTALLKNDGLNKNPFRNSYIAEGEQENVDKLVSYKYPIVAKAMNWVLTQIFLVKSKESQHLQEAKKRRRFTMVFDSFRDSTKSGQQPDSNSLHNDTSLDRGESSSLHSMKYDDHESSRALHPTDRPDSVDSVWDNNRAESSHSNRHFATKVQPDRNSSINLGVLSRDKANPFLQSELSSNSLKLSNPSALQKMLHRGKHMSTNWNNKFSTHKGKERSKSVSESIRPPSKQQSDNNSIIENDEQQQGEESIPLHEIFRPLTNELTEAEEQGYPRELSPRPQTSKILSRRPSVRVPVHTPVESIAEEINTVYEVMDAQAPKYNNSGASPLFVDRANDQSTKQRSMAINTHDGLKYGHTTVTNISNWQDENTPDEDRITTVSEPWDIEEQLKESMKM